MIQLKKVLTSPPALIAIDYSEGAGEIILAVDFSKKGWGAVLMQMTENKKTPSRYKSGMWNEIE